jgi:hypothetical protein
MKKFDIIIYWHGETIGSAVVDAEDQRAAIEVLEEHMRYDVEEQA